MCVILTAIITVQKNAVYILKISFNQTIAEKLDNDKNNVYIK